MTRTVAWFSAGAASAVATKLALAECPELVVAYCDTGSEHPDNIRFLDDCEAWFDRPIIRLKSAKYDDVWDVWSKTRFLVGPEGARCTGEMKRAVRHQFQQPADRLIFGYTADERGRVDRFLASEPGVNLWCPLIDGGITKRDCLEYIAAEGITLPAMYLLGYRNNNCLGCVKGGMGYWNKIRVDFPEVFDRMAVLERGIGHAVNAGEIKVDGRRQSVPVYLDELDPSRGRYQNEDMTCGFVCEPASA